MQQIYGLYGQPFYFNVVRQIGCNVCSLQCGNVHRNSYYTVINKITPMYYFYQVPDELIRMGTNGYLYADSSMMQNNFIDYWSRNIYEEYEQNQAREELKRLFKGMLDMASKVTENKNPQLSIVFNAFGIVMADNFADVLLKANDIYRKYAGLVNKNNNAKC